MNMKCKIVNLVSKIRNMKKKIFYYNILKTQFSFIESIEVLVDGESYGIFKSSLSNSSKLRPLDPHIKMQQDAWKLGSYLAPFDKMVIIKRIDYIDN